jgi:hypothetical protein
MLKACTTIMTESQLTRAVIKMLRREYPDIWFYKVNDRFTAGIPDILMCIEGHLHAIELKVGNNKPTRLQQYVINKINASGGRAMVCRSIDEVRRFIERR